MLIPDRPPFILRARILTPLTDGGTEHDADGLVSVDSAGRIDFVGTAGGHVDFLAAAHSDDDSQHALGDVPETEPEVVDIRPLVLMPGMVDLHVHLPQLPNAGLGAGLDLLTWLERYIFPLEREWEDPAVAERLAPRAFGAFAAAGTTTVLAYGAVFAASLDAAFRAAEAHGIRAILGKVMMDRLTYDERIDPATILDRSLREANDLCARWHGAEAGRLGYAYTPRFAVSCTAEMLRESAAAARSTGAYWQTHVSEDRAEIAEVARLFPEARDYVDVYDQAGGLGERSILAHAVHLNDREIARLAETGTRIAHCPASNLFLASGTMPLARYVEVGLSIGLGSDVAAGPELSIFSAMRAGAYTQSAVRLVVGDERPVLEPLDWLRMGTLGGASALGLQDRIGSIEYGKEADLIAIDPGLTAPIRGVADEDPADLMSRLIFRTHPDMVRAAWVRGRRLDGPPG